MTDPRVIAFAQKMAIAGIILSILALMFIPLLPWVGYTYKTMDKDLEEKEVTTYISEADIHMYAEHDYYSGGSSDYYDDMDKAVKDLDKNIGYATLMFWLALLFLIIGIIGVAVYKIGTRAEMAGKILMIIGAFALIFAVLSVVFSALCFTNVQAMQSATQEYYDDMNADYTPTYFLGYNYLPLIFGIILLIITALFMAKVVPPLVRSFRRYPPGYGPGPYPPPHDRGGPGPGPGPGYDEPPRGRDDYGPPPPRDEGRWDDRGGYGYDDRGYDRGRRPPPPGY